MSSGNVHTRINALYKQSFGSLLNTQLYRFPDLEVEAVEDILQEAFSTALSQWQRDFIPDNPKGWLYAVSENRAINLCIL